MSNCNFFLEIVVLSYGRPKELSRILDSFINYENNNLLLTIREDNSPFRDEVINVVENFLRRSDLKIKVNPIYNNNNLGYDSNLLESLELSSSKYLMFLSDDDCIDINYLDKFIFFIKNNQSSNCFLPAFLKNNNVHRLGSDVDVDIYDINSLYNSILFSGITFRVSNFYLNSDFKNELINSIYTQVYLVALMSKNSKISYFNYPLIKVFEDGENFFGVSDSTKNLDDLLDREDLLSNFRYQKRLMKVVFMVDRDFYSGIYLNFLNQMYYRAIAQFLKFRGQLTLISYFKLLRRFGNLDFYLPVFYIFVINSFILIPGFIASTFYKYIVNNFRKSGG